MSELIVTIPNTPSKDLAPNKARQLGWRGNASSRADSRAQGRYCAMEAIAGIDRRPVFDGPVTVEFLIAWGKGERRLDFDALPGLTKHLIDGLTDAGVWSDDSVVESGTWRQMRDPAKVGFVTVIIREER